jgi:chromate reductase, NAD(P)H dehydrogenase (quinone)
MVQRIEVAVFIGSLRKASINRMVANALIELAPAELKLSIVEIDQLPLYNQDMEENPPPQWIQLRERIKTAAAVLFVTPEYNRSVPAALKNALDVGSRPYGMNTWSGRPGAVVSASPGAIGGFGANHHLRQSLVFLNVPAMPQPETYIGHADKRASLSTTERASSCKGSCRPTRHGSPPTGIHKPHDRLQRRSFPLTIKRSK